MHGVRGCHYRRGLVECRSTDREIVPPTLKACLYLVSKFRLRNILWLLCFMLVLKLGICLSKARVASMLKFNRNIARCMLRFCGLVLEFSFLGNLSKLLVLGDYNLIVSRRSFSSLDACSN